MKFSISKDSRFKIIYLFFKISKTFNFHDEKMKMNHPKEDNSILLMLVSTLLLSNDDS